MRWRAWRMVRYHVSRGFLFPEPCAVCGSGRTDAHHDDYRKPLVVRWLCRSHHTLWHRTAGRG